MVHASTWKICAFLLLPITTLGTPLTSCSVDPGDVPVCLNFLLDIHHGFGFKLEG